MRPMKAIASAWSRTAAARAAQLPAGAVATRSASAASRCARPEGIRAAGGGAVRSPPPPQPARTSAQLQAPSEALGQRIGQPPLANLLLRALDRVLDARKERPASLEVEHEPGGARVAVARLADRARVDQEAAGAE